MNTKILLAMIPLAIAFHGKPACAHKNALTNSSTQAVLTSIKDALKSSKKSAVIYYSNTCAEGKEKIVPFPLVDLQTPLKIHTGVVAIKEIFNGDKNVVVAEWPTGVIRIKVGKISTAILKARVSVLALKPLEQYNPSLAISALENSASFTKVMHVHDVRISPILFDTLLVQPQKGQPHLPSKIEKATVGHVLSSIAATFRGVVVYGTCKQPDGTQLLTIFFSPRSPAQRNPGQ